MSIYFDDIVYERKPVREKDVTRVIARKVIPLFFRKIVYNSESLFGMDKDPAFLFTTEFPYPSLVERYFVYESGTGDEYFVSTEGYNYMRYVVRLV